MVPVPLYSSDAIRSISASPRSMPRCQPQLWSTERRSRAPAAGVYGGGPPRPRPPPCAPAGGAPPCAAGPGPAPCPACALAVSGAASANAIPSAIVVRIIPCRDAITSLLSSVHTALLVGREVDFLLVLQHDRSEKADGGAVERRIEGDGDLVAILDPIRAGGGDPGVGQDVRRPRRQLPHLGLAILVLDGDMQRAVRVRKRKFLNDAGRPFGLVQVVHAGKGMMRQQRTGSYQPQQDDSDESPLVHRKPPKILDKESLLRSLPLRDRAVPGGAGMMFGGLGMNLGHLGLPAEMPHG